MAVCLSPNRFPGLHRASNFKTSPNGNLSRLSIRYIPAYQQAHAAGSHNKNAKHRCRYDFSTPPNSTCAESKVSCSDSNQMRHAALGELKYWRGLRIHQAGFASLDICDGPLTHPNREHQLSMASATLRRNLSSELSRCLLYPFFCKQNDRCAHG